MADIASPRRMLCNLAGLPLALLAALLLLACPTFAALFPPNSAVLSLDAFSFPSKILQVEKPAIVAFTAPWCGHCQRLTPEFSKAAKNLEGIVHFANVDCDEDKNKPLCAKYDVKGFPTILLFPATKKRVPRPYQGEREAKTLVEYAISTLPHSVKKLNAEELGGWVRGISAPSADGSTTKGVNGKGKVLLFSNKPTSSPLYKSLALDFRKSFDFAFARGDQDPVKSSAKVSLGIDIKGDQDLPILVVYPPPSSAVTRGEDDFDKSKFETYEGKLKIGPLSDWLRGVKERFSVEDVKEGQGSKKKSSKPKKSPSHADTFEKPLPDGAFYEWKPAGDEPKHRYSEQAEEIKRQHEDLAKKKKGEKGAAEKLAFGERHRVPKKEQQIPFEGTATGSESDGSDSAPPPVPEEASAASPKSAEAADAGTKDQSAADPSPAESPSTGEQEAGEADAQASPSSRGYIYTDSQRADLDALNSLLEEAGAYDFAEKAAEKAGNVAEGVKNSARQVYENVRKAASEALKSDSPAEGKDAVAASDSDSIPFTKKRKALLSAFTKWLQDEHPDWETDYSSDFLDATRDVEKLLREDPEKARKMAEESEVEMLREFKVDLERMGGEGVLGQGKRAKLEELITLLEGRVKARAAVKKRDEWIDEVKDGKESVVDAVGEGAERVAEAIRGLTGEDAKVGGVEQKEDVKEAKQGHDEL